MPAAVVDGNDLFAVVEAPARRSSAPARAAGRRCSSATYRHYGHSKSDPATYRPEGELERWMERDPLDVARARLLEGGVSEEEIEAAEEATGASSTGRSKPRCAAPYPDPAVDGRRSSRHEHARVPRRDPRRHRRGDGARRSVVFFWARTSPSPAASSRRRPACRALRPGPRVRHADLRAGARRRRVRRRGHRAAPDLRDHVRRLHGAGDGLARQPGREVLVHLQRAGQSSRSSSARRSAAEAASARSTRRPTGRGSRASRA